MKRFILLAILAIVPTLASAQVYAMRDSVSNGYDFWLYVPTDYSDNRANRLAAADSVEVAKPLPVIVFLHGRSLSGNNINKVREYGTIDALWRGRKIDAVVIAPQVNHGDWWRPERVMNVVEWVSQRYDVDLTRLYVLGMSLGGYGTLDFAATYPDRTAAAGALCGGSSKRGDALHKLNEVPLWIMHGTADAAVAVSESRRVKAGMSEGDASLPRLRYDEQVGANHSVYARVFYVDEIYTWLMKHSITDSLRPVDTSVQLPYSRFSTSRSAYAGLPRGGGKVQIIDPPTTSNTKGRYLDESGAPAQAPQPAVESGTSSEEKPQTSEPQQSKPAATTPSTNFIYHTIVDGDTLGHIAAKYGTTVSKLCQLNNMQKSDILKLGKRLVIGYAPAQPEVAYHTVQTGDSYWKIAQKYKTTTDELFRLNNISSETILHPGDKIIVSSKMPANSSQKSSQKSSNTANSSSSAQYHTITDGDTLGHLAVKYKTTVKRICELNGITDTTILKLGKKLRVK
ncbi:MAG: LysM peptidoglycan-binding domain-containing protein [Alistipes sp.]|nr:LysM peptidoglycan-binding domain-containing protein [Alistipes sp.]